ncbi:MAG: hypothetical protein QNL62_16480 [Gammaproteobacteria bacterium]|nr:hypothetical protein [Gammaproteobacteria bacterium]
MSNKKKGTSNPSGKNNKNAKNYCIDFHGAAIINQDGQEIAITEEMVENACNQLMEDETMTPYFAPLKEA